MQMLNRTTDKTTSIGHTTYIYQILKFLNFPLFLYKALWFKEKVENRIIMTSRNDVYELPILILGITFSNEASFN